MENTSSNLPDFATRSLSTSGARDAFLACFDPRHRQEVVEFGKRLRHVEADYYMFMARKAVCFYECLAALRLTELRGILLSDRVLDMDLSWLRGKRIALVDDAVIYGTTLAEIRDKLRNAGAVVSDIVVFCVNTTSWQPERVSPTEPFLRLDEKETTGFCADLVRAISVVPMPYAVDYPIVRKLRIGDESLGPLACLPGWDTKSHTTPLQFANGVSTLVCIPTLAKRLDVFPEHESALSGVCHLAKVRLYGRHLVKHEATWFTVMPVVVLDPMQASHVDDLWNCLVACVAPETATLLNQHFTGVTSRLRALQFVIASRLVSSWIRDARALLGLKIAPRIDAGFAGFSFTPTVSRLLCSVAAKGVDFSAARSIKPANAAMLRIEHPLETYEPNPWGIQAALMKIFLDLHIQKEIPARQKRLAIDELPDAVKNRLKEGFSLPQLSQCVAAVSGEPTKISVLSEFLDHAIDRGFVVPITAVHNDVVFRAYRYGEDIRDAEQFRQLCTRCGQSFLDASGLTGIARTWLEKLLVLLLQGLVDLRLLDPTDLAMGSSGTLGVRFALHGAVVKEGATHIYSHYDGEFYVDVLHKYGYFRLAGSAGTQPDLPLIDPTAPRERIRRYLPVVSREPIPESAPAVAAAVDLGLLIGCLAAKSSPAFTLKDLTLIATCHSPDATAAALAAELDILRKDWRFTERQLLNSNSDIVSADLRDKTWFTALNSARFKYRDYMQDVAEKNLDRLESELVSNSGIESKFLLSSLKTFRRSRLPRTSYSAVDPRYLLLLEMGRLLYELNILVRLLMLSLEDSPRSDAATSVSVEIHQLNAEHELLLVRATPTPQPEHEISNVVLTALKRATRPGVNLRSIRRWTERCIAEKVAHAGEYLDRVDHLVSRVGLPNEFDLFPHVLLIEPESGVRSRPLDRALDGVLIRSGKEFNGRQSVGRAYSFAFYPESKKSGLVAVGFRGDSARGLLDSVLSQLTASQFLPAIRRLLVFPDIERAEQPLKSECSPRCVAGLFWGRAEACLRDPRLSASGLYRLELSENQLKLDIDLDSLEVRTTNADVLTLTAPTEKSYCVEYKPMDQSSKSNLRRTRTRVHMRTDVGIICATPPELRALKEAMEELAGYAEEKKFEYYAATLPGEGCNHRVVMTYTTDQGQVSAALAAGKFLRTYRPRLLVMLGMAGSVSSDAKLLDVAISTQVIYYEPRKERDEKVSPRVQSLPISAAMKRVISSFMAANGAPQTLLEYQHHALSYKFNVLDGPLGTGEAIVGSTNSAARQLVLSFNDKTLVCCL
jgi:nucleoside phosphorylase